MLDAELFAGPEQLVEEVSLALERVLQVPLVQGLLAQVLPSQIDQSG